jgi:uncharacterized protein YpiB (UPF0302 family)
MKEQAQEKQKRDEQFYLSLAAQLILDESINIENKKRLMQQIDHALQNNEYKKFIRLSELYKSFV